MQKKTIWDMQRPDAATYAQSAKMPVLVVLDNVRSLLNIGSIFRTCDAFCVSGITGCGITAMPPNAEIHKSALGAELTVPSSYCQSTPQAVKALKDEGYTIVVLEQVIGSVSLEDFKPGFAPGKKYALVPGNEVDGVDPEVVNMADICLEIPQGGTKHSLNVAVSTGIALWKFYEQYITQTQHKP